MQFALIGDHEDGLAMARALAASGRHRLHCYSGPVVGEEYLRRWDLAAATVHDLEEVLADPVVEAVIVAGAPANRAAQLRRALQSERHVLCVHPADQRADAAYEAASIRRETGCVLLPILPGAFHPGLERLAKLIAEDRATQSASPRLIALEHFSTETVLYDTTTPGHAPGFPGWEMLRVLAGKIVEVSAFANLEEIHPDEPILLSGRFERGGLFHATLVPNQPAALFRVSVLLRYHRAELLFPDGWPGPARLTWVDAAGQAQTESWDDWDPWPRLVEVFELALALARPPLADKHFDPAELAVGPLSWEDEVRCLELDDAARRSLERRRSSTLEFQEDIEEATFKGTMTLFGCALLWVSLFLLILSRWIWWLGWLIVPLCVVFLGLQFLRRVIPARENASVAASPEKASRKDAKEQSNAKGDKV